jgi:hypothetical protein
MNFLIDELSYILAKAKHVQSGETFTESQKRVRSRIRAGLRKAIAHSDIEFEIMLTKVEYGTSSDALEAVYTVFKDVIEDDDRAGYIKLSISL